MVSFLRHTDIQRENNSLYLYRLLAVKENVAVRGTNLMSAVLLMLQICTILFDKPRRVFAESVSVLGKLCRTHTLLFPNHVHYEMYE